VAVQIIEGDFPVTLTGCCMVCNEVKVFLDAAGTATIENACDTCRQDIIRFLAFHAVDSPEGNDSVLRRLVEDAERILRGAKLPLICGLADQSFQVQQAAVELAKRCNAVIDWTSGPGAIAFQNAFQDCGWVSCTFGEIQQRCDLVIAWSCDVNDKYPEFAKRFVGSTDTVVIDWPVGKLNSALRFLRGDAGNQEQGLETGFQDLKTRIDAAKYPVFVIDESLAQTVGEPGVLGLARFVRKQNDLNRCRLVKLSRPGSIGIQSAMTSLAGAPFAVAFQDGRPVYRGSEFTAENLLSRNGVDALVLIGSAEQLSGMPLPESAARIHIADYVDGSFNADVSIPIARWGLDTAGIGIRADGVPIQRGKLFETARPNGVELLNAMVAT